ncbi:Short-chain-enoyl-CoA hydratase [Thalassocella blandensis]|nr:Short-chain-enoyl-CoA hydratase [Thalassocella blandensis]
MSEPALIIKTYECRDESIIGHIILNNPKALNALSIDMVDPMMSQLKQWKNNKKLVAVIISGAGDKALCAGGDLRDVHHAMTCGDASQRVLAERYFAREYRLDHMLHNYPKPVIVWGSGIVMGGGMGLFMAGDIRIATETTRMAMPEITIALFPDVGASYFLNQLPEHIGYFLALTGAIFNSEDALELGLANTVALNKDLPDIIEHLQEQTWSDDKEDNVSVVFDIVDTYSADAKEKLPPALLAPHQEIISELFAEADTLALIESFLQLQTKDEWLKQAQANLAAGSPLHAFIIHKQLKETLGMSLADVFRSEVRLATNIVRFSEFAEGIRALLIDKDRQPNWHFKTLKEVDSEFVDSFFKEPWGQNPLQDLN